MALAVLVCLAARQSFPLGSRVLCVARTFLVAVLASGAAVGRPITAGKGKVANLGLRGQRGFGNLLVLREVSARHAQAPYYLAANPDGQAPRQSANIGIGSK